MGQRLGIAVALLGDPPVVVLDEPVNGLDPEGIRWVRTLARQLAGRGPHGLRLQPPHVGDGADRRPPGRHRPRPDPRRLLDVGVHRRPRRLLRPGAQPPARRGRRPAAPARARRRRPRRGAAGPGPRRRRDRRARRQERPVPARADPRAVLARGRLHDLDRRQRGVPRRHSPQGSPDDHDRRSRAPSSSTRTRTSPASGGRASPTRCAPSGSSSGPCGRPSGRPSMLFVLGAGLTVLVCAAAAEDLASGAGRRVPGLLRDLGDDVRPDHRRSSSARWWSPASTAPA